MLKKILLIEGRNIGDAVISTGIINSLNASFPAAELHLLTRPQFKDVFANLPIQKTYYAQFPMGTEKHFGVREAYSLMKTMLSLRRMGFDLVINNMGDFREIFLLSAICRTAGTTITWAKGHPFNNLVRPGFHSLARCIEVPASIPNIYEAQKFFLTEIGCKSLKPPHINCQGQHVKAEGGRAIVGVHPFAGQACKMWPTKNWRELIRGLTQKCDVLVFCAPNQKKQAQELFADVIMLPEVKLVSETISEFFTELSRCDVLVALDSFSLHAAYALSVPSVMLNGGNDARIWLPPGAALVQAPDKCPFRPCYNKPRCHGSYVCMSGISVAHVAAAVDGQLARRQKQSPEPAT